MKLGKKIKKVIFNQKAKKRRLKDFENMRAVIATDSNRKDGIFDSDWYGKTYPDVLTEGHNAFSHYMNHGHEEGRNPGPNFDTRFYLSSYPDVGASGINPLLHYVLHGRAEGRQCKGTADLPEGLRHGIVKALALAPGDDAAIFVTHASSGRLKPHVQSCIEQISGTGMSVLLVAVTDQPLELLDKKTMSRVAVEHLQSSYLDN